MNEGGIAIAWIPDPDAPGRRAQLEAALDGGLAALGPAVALERAAASLARARAAHALAIDRRLKGDGLVVADEHLLALLLHGDDGLLGADLAERALAPLAELRPGARRRLTATLHAWLDHPGQVTRVAQELHVHPQTVRYRLASLRELFGERLDDPEARFELALALRAGPRRPSRPPCAATAQGCRPRAGRGPRAEWEPARRLGRREGHGHRLGDGRRHATGVAAARPDALALAGLLVGAEHGRAHRAAEAVGAKGAVEAEERPVRRALRVGDRDDRPELEAREPRELRRALARSGDPRVAAPWPRRPRRRPGSGPSCARSSGATTLNAGHPLRGDGALRGGRLGPRARG